MSALLPELADARVVDLFAGSGALGLEALSRGAAHATFVERGAGALKALRANLERLGALEQATVVRGDALRWTGRLEGDAFDVALADPPYDGDDAEALVRQWLRRPFAASLWIEHRTGATLPERARERSRRYGDTTLTTYRAEP